jgi:ADP-ribosylglycohydrolase
VQLPPDYTERVYAGVLGKIVGVYLGRPFEGWTYERIMSELGEIEYYVNEKRNTPLVVADDDISGTFTFLRALPDYGNQRDITSMQIGQTWLNYLIENRTVLWWGGLGNSTEHTAYLRLKSGIPAPHSGSIALNSRTVAEQIGAQIFIDGWGMVAPGDPELAADLAGRAGRVSHDGEAIYGAQVWAALIAQAFVESNLDTMLNTSLALIPGHSVIRRLISEIRELHAAEPDWHKARAWLAHHYGYDKYGGNCHIVPNHGVMMLGLLYGGGDFQRSLLVTNTSGWDTDCNSGNVGCLLGVWKGLGGIDDGPDWRGPVADCLYLPTADGGRCVTDALQEAYAVVNVGRALAGYEPVRPKGGVRFHFEMPGSVQGFQAEQSQEGSNTLVLENVAGHSAAGTRSLALRYRHLALGRPARVSTATFTPPSTRGVAYSLIASPTLYAGQSIRARLSADEAQEPVSCRLYLNVYSGQDQLTRLYAPTTTLQPGGSHVLSWAVPDTGGQPIAAVGLEFGSSSGARADGCVYLDYLTWEGTPRTTLGRPSDGGSMWVQAWTNGLDHFGRPRGDEVYRLVQDRGTGLAIQGTREWQDYSVSAQVTPHMATMAGLCARVQGMMRYYALVLCQDNFVRLIKVLDGTQILTEAAMTVKWETTYALRLEVIGTRLLASIDGEPFFTVEDTHQPLISGAVAMLCQEGRAAVGAVTVEPALPEPIQGATIR